MPSAPQTARATARAELTRAILDRASEQLAETGPAALSVRAVARDLGMASSAVYRYFPSRDALLTALLVEAYDDLGAAVEAAEGSVARRDLRGRWRAVAHALRTWALENPHRYALAHGSPVPGYAAPVDAAQAADRVPRALLGVVRDAQVAGRAPVKGLRVPAAEKTSTAQVSASTAPTLTPAYTVRALVARHTLFGVVSHELFGHLAEAVIDPDVHFAQVVDQLAADLGLS